MQRLIHASGWERDGDNLEFEFERGRLLRFDLKNLTQSMAQGYVEILKRQPWKTEINLAGLIEILEAQLLEERKKDPRINVRI